MQQGLTDVSRDGFREKLPLKINARTLTLKVTYQELRQINYIPGRRMPAW
jgi:hypothetical protein